MRLRLLVPVAIASLLLLFHSPAFAVGIDLWPGYGQIQNQAQSTAGFDQGVYDLSDSLPQSGSLSNAAGASSADSTYDLTSDGFSLTLDHSIAAGNGALANLVGYVRFTPTTDVTYSADGFYSASDLNGRAIVLGAYLYDYTDSGYLFLSSQISDELSAQNFTLGLQEGNDQNQFIGSLTGTLLAGHLYEFSFEARVQETGSPLATIEGTAIGEFNLVFVPEPGIAPLGLTAAALLLRPRPVRRHVVAASRSSGGN